MFKRVLSLILALMIVSAPLFGGAGTVSAASTDDMEAIVEKQIRAFADSIDKSNADDAAAAALANHGIRAGGKTLKAGKSHALTALLFNSELLQTTLIKSCTAAIQSMQQLDLSALPYVGGNIGWYGAKSNLSILVFVSDDYQFQNWDWELYRQNPYSGKLNSYDNSLEWIVGTAAVVGSIERTKTTATEQTYKVTCTISDRFDFSTSNGDGFKNLISGIGAVLFKEFNWESTVTFNLTVPYTCSHSSTAYHWTYDPLSNVMTSDREDGFTPNNAAFIHHISTEGINSQYFELEKTVRLSHSKPWVMEYDVKNPWNIAFAALTNNRVATVTCLTHFSHKGLFANITDYVTVSQMEINHYADYYCGTPIDQLFLYSPSVIYTYRLENKLQPDGSNMIYMTVSDKETGQILAENIPLDDYYYYERWTQKYTSVSKSSDWLSGQDLFVNYLGRQGSSFSADHFELRIWDNGIDGGSGTYYEGKVTKPTCTAQGYTTYTCACCGYSYKGDKTKATGHSYGDWTTVTAPTCTEAGEEQRKCKSCDASESRTVEAIGHNYENYVCTRCGDMDYIPGDVDINGTVDVDDVLALLWNVLFPEEYPIEVNADFDGNGSTDVDDVLKLLWFVLFPEEYPLN